MGSLKVALEGADGKYTWGWVQASARLAAAPALGHAGHRQDGSKGMGQSGAWVGGQPEIQELGQLNWLPGAREASQPVRVWMRQGDPLVGTVDLSMTVVGVVPRGSQMTGVPVGGCPHTRVSQGSVGSSEECLWVRPPPHLPVCGAPPLCWFLQEVHLHHAFCRF